MPQKALPTTLGQLRNSEFTPERISRSVKDELRDNLIVRLRQIAPVTMAGLRAVRDSLANERT